MIENIFFEPYRIRKKLWCKCPWCKKSCRPGEVQEGRGGEIRELHSVDAGESSASIATDPNSSFATPSIAEGMIEEITGSKTCGDS